MKKIVFLFVLSGFMISAGLAQQGDLLKRVGSVLGKSSGGALSADDIAAGLKEALTVGAQKSAARLSAENGFFANAAIKVLMPEEVKKVESTLRSMGMGKLVDDAILSMNRAAEEASKSAAPIFVQAVKSMSIKDAAGILRGADNAATVYLKDKTADALTSSFRPVIEQALEKTGATKHWSAIFERYNKIPLSKKVDTDLAGYVTAKALDGMFFQLAEEEKKIRKDPAARVSETLKKVFG